MNTVQASIRQATAHWSARQISILFTIVALILWSYSITQAKFEIGFYGLIVGFPVAFFISLGILTIASAILWVSRENHGKLLFLQLCFLIVSLYMAPMMVGGATQFGPTAYGDMGFIEYIIRQGHFSQQYLWQHNWPPAWIFWATGIHVSGGTMDGFASLIPWLTPIWQFVMFFPLFMFFRNTIGKANPNYCWAAMWLFYLGNWFDTQDTGAQAFGVFFAFSILAFLTMTPSWQQRARTLGYRFSAIILFAVSAVAHLLGSFVGLATTAALYASKRVRSSNLVILAAVFIVAWSLYGAASFFNWELPIFVRQGLRIDVGTEKSVLNPLSGSEAHAAVAKVRIIFSGLFSAIAILGALLAWRLRKSRYNDITVLAIAVGCGFSAVGIGAGYTHELYQRFFVFFLPVIAYFGVKLLHLRATVVLLCLLLLLALPLAFVAKHGNQTMDYLSPGYFSGASFFQDNTSGGYIVGGSPLGSMKYYERYKPDFSFDDLQWQDDKLVPFGYGGPFDVAPRYICISSHNRAMYSFYYNEPQLIDHIESSLNATVNCDLVYANRDLRLYVDEQH